MQHQEFAAPGGYGDRIKCLWYNRRDVGMQPASFEVMPDGYAEIIFHFRSTCSVSLDGLARPLPSPFLMGLLDQPVIVTTINSLEIIGIRCFPWAVFDLLGLAAGKDRVRTFEHPIARLHPTLERSIRAGRIEEAVSTVSAFFSNARSQSFEGTTLAKAGGAMRAAKGTMPVSQVAAAAHASVRTLERKFKQSSGRSVKDVSGLMRFEQVRNRLWLSPGSNLAALAHELGYTDQSHQSRDFRRYSGTTPASFARKAKLRKLTAGGEIVAFIQA